jgi:hypothetical protein
MSFTLDHDAILPLYAGLNPDGTIELELGLPGEDEPVTVTVPATDESRRLARPGDQRMIDLATTAPGEMSPLLAMIDEYTRSVWRKLVDRQAGPAR